MCASFHNVWSFSIREYFQEKRDRFKCNSHNTRSVIYVHNHATKIFFIPWKKKHWNKLQIIFWSKHLQFMWKQIFKLKIIIVLICFEFIFLFKRCKHCEFVWKDEACASVFVCAKLLLTVYLLKQFMVYLHCECESEEEVSVAISMCACIRLVLYQGTHVHKRSCRRLTVCAIAELL